jgi:hypothetical protein
VGEQRWEGSSLHFEALVVRFRASFDEVRSRFRELAYHLG